MLSRIFECYRVTLLMGAEMRLGSRLLTRVGHTQRGGKIGLFGGAGVGKRSLLEGH
jgi:flagellar biosynthesis/type III secretory pathway ATPase